MPSDLTLKAMNGFHRAIMLVTGGRLGWSVGGMPVLELTTTGRTSGQPRAVMLTSPLHVADAYVVVASRGGDDQHPNWFLNLQRDPDVTVRVQGQAPQPRRARVATDAEREELWPRITGRYKNYAG